MNLPILPAIPEVFLRRNEPLVLVAGEVVAWEPDLEHARQLVVITRVVDVPGDERRIWARALASMTGDGEYWNDESRCREFPAQALRRT